MSNEMNNKRFAAAQEKFESFNFDCNIEAHDGWEYSSHHNDWVKTIYIEAEDSPESDTIKGHFTVLFYPGTDEVAECYASVNGVFFGYDPSHVVLKN